MNRGFTVIEVLICLAIFIVITTLVMTRFGDYSRQGRVRDTAYDIALILRQAQAYGLSVKNASPTDVTDFSQAFGLAFSDGATNPCGGATPSSTNGFAMYVDSYPIDTGDNVCTDQDTDIRFYKYVQASQSSICVGATEASCTFGEPPIAANLYVTFRRPDPTASICTNSSMGATCGYGYAEIRLVGTDGSMNKVVVRNTGQISVKKAPVAEGRFGEMGPL